MLTPTGMVGTCTLGKPTMIDYVVHSIELNGLLTLRPDLHGTTRPHASFVLGIHRRPRTMMATQRVAPAEFPCKEKRGTGDGASNGQVRRASVETEREVRNSSPLENPAAENQLLEKLLLEKLGDLAKCVRYITKDKCIEKTVINQKSGKKSKSNIFSCDVILHF